MNRPRTPPSLKRKSPFRRPKIKLLIICEGKNTEPNYIENLANHFGNGLVRLTLVRAAGVPLTLVNTAVVEKKALSRKTSFERDDQVWVVFDKDTHPNIPQAMNIAKGAGVRVAYSNPCFELWAVLHIEDMDAPLTHHQVQRHLKTLDPKYDPNSSKEVDFELLVDGYDEAVKRAIRMRKRRIAEGVPLGVPYTDFDVLSQLIVDNGKIRKK